MLQVGALGFFGLSLHDFLRLSTVQAAAPQKERHFGKAKARHTQNFLDMGNGSGRLNFDAKQQFARRIERPGISQTEVCVSIHTPNRCG